MFRPGSLARPGADASLPALVTDNLLLHLDAGDPDSYPGTGTAWTDLVGGYVLTLSGGVSYQSSVGALRFNGTTGAANGLLPAPATFFSSLTGSVFVIGQIFAYRVGGAWPLFSYNRQSNSNVFKIGVNPDGQAYSHFFPYIIGSSPHLYTPNIYHSTASTYVHNSASGNLFYQDANYIGQTGTIGFPGSGGHLDIGYATSGFGTDYLQGDIAVVLIYNKVLTAAEVTQLHSHFRPRFGLL